MRFSPVPFTLLALGLTVPPALALNNGNIALMEEGRIVAFSSVAVLNLMSGGWCTGVLIGKNTILTAAHCIQGIPKSDPITVVFPEPGDWVRMKDLFERFPMERILTVQNVIRHPSRAAYPLGEPMPGDTQWTTVDMALLQIPDAPLRPPFKFKVVDLLTPDVPVRPGDPITLSGMGTDENGDIGLLKEGPSRVERVEKNVLLTRGSGAKLSTRICPGDSGGGMFIEKNSKWYVAGVNRSIDFGMSKDELLQVKMKHNLPLTKLEECRTEYSDSTFVPDNLQFIAAAGQWDAGIASWAKKNGITPLDVKPEKDYWGYGAKIATTPPATLEQATLTLKGAQSAGFDGVLLGLTENRQSTGEAGSYQVTYRPQESSKDHLLTVQVQNTSRCTLNVFPSQLMRDGSVGLGKTSALTLEKGSRGTLQMTVRDPSRHPEATYTLTLQGSFTQCKG